MKQGEDGMYCTDRNVYGQRLGRSCCEVVAAAPEAKKAIGVATTEN